MKVKYYIMKKKIIIIIIIILFAGILAYGLYYVNDYYHADETAQKYINGTDNVSVIKTSNGLLLDGPGNDTALIFYPGAKIEYTSYLPLFTQVSSEGIDCFLVDMPFKLALLGKDCADDIINEYDYDHYVMCGHSLGGFVASQYVNETNNTDALILLAGYSQKSIDKPVLSIYGSQDEVLNMETYKDNHQFIEKNLTEVVIDGGNHEQIGNYGIHPGEDGAAKITPQEQQSEMAQEIIRFIDNIN